MSILINNISKLYTPDTAGGYGDIVELNSPRILIKDGYIEDIITDQSVNLSGQIDEIIDARGMVLLPGFIDGHTHPVFWQTREAEFIMRAEGKSYEEIAAAGGHNLCR